MAGVAPALKAAGAVAVYIAAEPSSLARLGDAHKRGIDRIIYDGCNMLKTLAELQDMMRVEELGEADSDEFEDEDEAPDETRRGGRKRS
jgi:hypothetical protein